MPESKPLFSLDGFPDYAMPLISLKKVAHPHMIAPDKRFFQLASLCLIGFASILYLSYTHIALCILGNGELRCLFLNFRSHFMAAQIFQMDLPFILSASKYFR